MNKRNKKFLKFVLIKKLTRNYCIFYELIIFFFFLGNELITLINKRNTSKKCKLYFILQCDDYILLKMYILLKKLHN